MIDLPAFDVQQAERLRSDAHAMVTAYVSTVLEEAGEHAIAGIYAKGSAYKPWDSIIDYVPEISDVDLHVRFVDDRQATAVMTSLDRALRIAQRSHEKFRAAVTNPTHLPRPQLLALNTLEALPGYLPSPTPTVHTLFGEPFQGATRADYAHVQTADAERFTADAEYVQRELPEKVIDRPGHHAWRAISLLAWRVSPAGPRLLTNLEMDPYDAWTLNRSGVIQELANRGHAPLAHACADFYLAAWDGANSGFRDDEAAQRALNAVGRLYSEGTAFLRQRAHTPNRE